MASYSGHTMTKEQIREIFIEEASEIIEKLDIDIVDLEADPGNKELLGELFRGVHTLKGSANSFGFTRLGEFVHHFEDVLDHFRSSEDEITKEHIDLFLKAVMIIKEVMSLEVEEIPGLPAGFDDVSQGIQAILSDDPVDGDSQEPLADLADEFAEFPLLQEESDEGLDNIEIEHFFKMLEDDEELYHIVLTLDDDIFFRGSDHARLFHSLSEVGRLLGSWWDMDDVTTLESFDPERNSIRRVDLLLASSSSQSTLDGSFEYIDDHEYTLRAIEKVIPVESMKPNIHDDANIKATRKRPKLETLSFIKVHTSRLDELFASIGELVIAQNFIADNEDIQRLESESVTQTMNALSKITRSIQKRVMSLRMVSVGDVFDKMRLVARDASHTTGKIMTLELQGEETEIDKTMVDALSDPLIHLLRNAIDHGLEEDIEERRALGKTGSGTIRLRAYHRGGNIAIEISDDGRGIDRDKVLSKAIERGLVTEGEILDDAEVFAMIMQAGFSTCESVTEISGRGVGLDVVRSSVERLRGRIEITSEVGKGSTFTVLLPLTLAIIDGMLVRSAESVFIIPTLSVVESFIPSREIAYTVKHQGEFVDLRGEMLPIVRLNHALELNTDRPEIWESTLICVEGEKEKYTLLVDELIGRQQVVIKSLGPVLSKIREFSGSAIMGSGDIAFILNIEELLRPSEVVS